MKVFLPGNATPMENFDHVPCVVTIGNFDGCHIGHQALIEESLQLSKTLQIPSAVLTFDPNPKQFFRPNEKIGKIFTLSQKTRAILELGIKQIFIQEFDQTFSKLSAQEFFDKILVQKLKAKALVVGNDFSFGHNREGDINLLKNLAELNKIKLSIIPQLTLEGAVVSSSTIRKLLTSSRIQTVNAMLGRCFAIEGRVIHGDKLGRTIGFPTANIGSEEQLLPAAGVYACRVSIGNASSVMKLPNATWPAVMNIGIRPTVGISEMRIEVHILGRKTGPDELYGQSICVYLVDFIRHEMKFESLTALQNQIRSDIESAEKILQ